MTDQNLADVINEMLLEASRIRRYDLDDRNLKAGFEAHIKIYALRDRARSLMVRYAVQLRNTPEEEYMIALSRVYGVEEQNPLLYRPITCMQGLDVRVLNCLEVVGIIYVGELVQTTEKDLLKLRSFGKLSLHKVKEELSRIRLSLGMKLDNYVPPH